MAHPTDPIRVVVTGAGSGVGQGVMKALRASGLPVHLIAADIGPMNSGLYRADEALLLPRVEETGSLPTIITKLKEARVAVVMIGSEFDLKFFSRHRNEIEAGTGAVVIVSPPSTVEIAEDKWLTTEFLRQAGLPFAEACVARDSEDARATAAAWGYPLVLKTRTGTSSRHVHIVRDDKALAERYAETPEPMLQRMIAAPSHELASEYTCSVFRCRDGRLLGPFTSRRTLRAGSSWVVEVDRFRELEPLLLQIAEKLPFMGSLNVQLMKDASGQAVPFEFNARFSGTTAIRAHFGFNEPEMAVRSYWLDEPLAPPVIRRGIAMRYLEEVFIEGVGLQDLRFPFPKGDVRHWF